ncbi:MAG TPA: phage baseplate protein [Thermoanaerobaculia bacterium]|nr:phage baseplate protein [Thermoanaerobaculia bacterium]
MRPLAAREVLDVWEQGQGYGPTVRALVLLAAACSEEPWEELEALPLGERDRRLLGLRIVTAGRRLDAFAGCPSCGEPLDLSLDAGALLNACGPALSEGELAREDLALRFRPVTSADLLAVERCLGVEEARRSLAGCCLLEARRIDRPVEVDELSDEELADLSKALADSDPGAELLFDLRCPACESVWQQVLDVAAFVWEELEAQARRILGEVHVLARAYGWREADVLALSPRRRRLYLEMVGA